MPTDMRSVKKETTSVKKETTNAYFVGYSPRGRNSSATQPTDTTLLSTSPPNQALKTRSHFPQTLAPFPPSPPPLPTHQCGSAAPQQPLLPSPMNKTLSCCLKPLRLCCDLQSFGSPQTPGPGQHSTRAVSMAKLSAQPYAGQQNFSWRKEAFDGAAERKSLMADCTAFPEYQRGCTAILQRLCCLQQLDQAESKPGL